MNIQLGSQGAEVKSVQTSLLQLGYQITPDGIFGNTTQAVVIQFQKANGLTADGIVGNDTFAKINSASSTPTTLNGMDISHLNGTINWETLSNDIRFVYCKASQGSTFKDPMLRNYFDRLSKKGIIRGAYHFLNFVNSTAEDQIDNFLDCGIDFSLPGTLPPVLDVEWMVPSSLNAYIFSNRAACVQLIRDWLTGVKTKTGRNPIIYTNRSFWHDYLGNPSGFGEYPLWIAAYQATPPGLPPGWTNYTFWQYNGNGTVAGVTGPVDRDYFNGSMADLKKLALL